MPNSNSIVKEFHEIWNQSKTEVEETVDSLKLPGRWSVLTNHKHLAPEEISKQVFIDEIPVPKQLEYDDCCSIETLMFTIIQLQAHYCRLAQQIVDGYRPKLMELYSGANNKQCCTYATWGAKSWKYLGAAMQITSAFVPFSGMGDAAKLDLASKGISGSGQAFGGVGHTWDEHYSGERTGYQHEESYMRRLVENSDRTCSNVYSSIEVLARLIADIANKLNQAKTEMLR